MRGIKHDETLHPQEFQNNGVHQGETVIGDEIHLLDTGGKKEY